MLHKSYTINLVDVMFAWGDATAAMPQLPPPPPVGFVYSCKQSVQWRGRGILRWWHPLDELFAALEVFLFYFHFAPGDVKCYVLCCGTGGVSFLFPFCPGWCQVLCFFLFYFCPRWCQVIQVIVEASTPKPAMHGFLFSPRDFFPTFPATAVQPGKVRTGKKPKWQPTINLCGNAGWTASVQPSTTAFCDLELRNRRRQGKTKITINLCVDGHCGDYRFFFLAFLGWLLRFAIHVTAVNAKNNNQPLHRRLWARCATVDWFFPWLRFAIRNRSAPSTRGKNKITINLCVDGSYFFHFGVAAGLRSGMAVDNEKNQPVCQCRTWFF